MAGLRLGLGGWVCCLFLFAAHAQPTSLPPAQWQVFLDGEQTTWSFSKPWPRDSLQQAATEVLSALQRKGFYFATLDSVATSRATAVLLYLSRGPEVLVGAVSITGATALDSLRLLDRLETRPGQILDPQRLAGDLDALLEAYDAAGFPLAQIRLAALDPMPDNPQRLQLTLHITEGPRLPLVRVVLEGAGRTRPSYVAQLAGLRLGAPLTNYDPAELQRRLEETDFFSTVGAPTLHVLPDSGAVLRIPLEEAPPGSFDLVLGYLPATRPGTSGSLVGSGHLVLRNVFGGGRTMALKLNRMPGQVSSVDARLADPYLFGWPFGVEGSFSGLQQDSTFGKQSYQAVLSYRFLGGLRTFGSLSRELTRPGQAGVRLRQGQQRIPRAEALFVGIGMRYQRLDRTVNPRQGLWLETNFERGRKSRSGQRIDPTTRDTTFERTVLRQERLRVTARGYVPTFTRQLVALGVDAAALISNAFDESDLFRFGGATTLRGYDEERFRGSFVGRALAEYRYQLDRRSYAFLFFDLGYVQTPRLGDLAATRGFYPGYGLGIQFSTALGLINASYALNTEDGPTNGKVHVGLSFGL